MFCANCGEKNIEDSKFCSKCGGGLVKSEPNNKGGGKLSKNLSWKLTLPLGAILWLVGHGGLIGLGGFVIFMMGIIDLFRNVFKKK